METILLIVAVLLLIVILTIMLLSRNRLSPEQLLGQLKESFQAISFSTLTDQTRLGEETLDKKKELIDGTLKKISEEMARVQLSIQQFDKQSKSGFDVMMANLQQTTQATTRLQQTTGQLKEALSSSQARGQWGERMAEDILRLAGFVENVNYRKQQQLGTGSRPDFTFLLPQDRVVHMDVKFPFDNFLNYLGATSDLEKKKFRDQFLRDVKQKISELKGRQYINPEENTLDYVILFIPNEQVYGFIHEQDRSVLDQALQLKVVICSPFTLYAILAIIRQAMDHFHLELRTGQIFKYLTEFETQWQEYKKSLEKMGRALESAQNEFLNLNTTRANKLEKPLEKISELRQQQLPPESGERSRPFPTKNQIL